MNYTKNNSLLTKIFIGAILTNEIRMFLSQSESWKQDQAICKANSLMTTRHQDVDYIGLLFDGSEMPYEDFEEGRRLFKKMLLDYCPSLDFGHIKSVAFPQVFLA